jgi:hypothetical protein
MSPRTASQPPGAAWQALVRKNGTTEFAAPFVPNPVLDISVLCGPCRGVDAIAAFFAATTSGMYDSLTFTSETVNNAKTYLEWEGTAFGKDVGGATILMRNDAGLIQSIRLYHRPLQVVQLFSTELAARLKGKLDPSLPNRHGSNRNFRWSCFSALVSTRRRGARNDQPVAQST